MGDLKRDFSRLYLWVVRGLKRVVVMGVGWF